MKLGLCSFVELTYKGQERNDIMTKRNLRKIDLQFFLRKIWPLHFSKRTISYGCSVSNITIAIIVWPNYIVRGLLNQGSEGDIRCVI